MGVWDKTTPAGSDNLRDGDDRLREAKDALEEALSHESSTFPGATPASTPIFIPGFLRGATGSRPTGDSLVTGRLYLNTTLNVIERYNGSTWDAILTTPGDGNVTNAKMATDSVDTSNIVDDAVTEKTTSLVTGRTAGTSMKTQAITIPTGAKVLVIVHGTIAFTIPSSTIDFYIQVTSDTGTLVGNYQRGEFEGSAGQAIHVPFCISFLDTLSSGATNYTLSYNATHSPTNFINVDVWNFSLIALQK